MGFFATKQKRGEQPARPRSRHLSRARWHGVPARFEAVAEALAAGENVHEACTVLGRELAKDGVDLGEALFGLSETFRLVTGAEPSFDDAASISVAWGEETLGFVHSVSCEDPLTGLASLAHLRARLSEVYRGVEAAGRSASAAYALVLIDLPAVVSPLQQELFGTALRVARTAEITRLVFSGGETMCQVGRSRLLLLVQRDQELGRKIGVLRSLLVNAGDGPPPRVWIEGLPDGANASVAVLDEVART